ncbi:MAG: hypothetical protein OQK51_25510 [Kangiellaceae bacterium]|nr:hypothetical protein [Kangiellaceae bacterium]
MYNQSVEIIFSEQMSESGRLRKVADFIEVSDGQVTYKLKKGGRTILTAWMPSAFEEVYAKVRTEHEQGNLELVFPKPDNT